METQMIPVEARVSDGELIQHLENLGLVAELTPQEKNTYLQIAKAFNLNPFKREIHVSKYGGQLSIITGYEVYIKRAERSGQLDGWSAITKGSVAGNDLKAVVTIHRKDRQHPFIWEASYNEFAQKNRDGHVTKFWQKADFMIKKVAISQAFRLCFSDELGGMPYTKEELPDNTEDAVATVVSSELPPKKRLSDQAFEKGIERIAAGEHSLIKSLKDTFILSDAQINKLIEIENKIANAEANPA